MPQEYTVRDIESGRIITFRWNDETPPTEADLAEVFVAAGQVKTPPSPEPSKGSGMLATIGGMAGGLAGGGKVSPIGMALAGLGGAAGQGVSEIVGGIKRPIEDVSGPIDALKKANAPLVRMARAGLEQAGLEGVGRGVGGLLSGAGRRLYAGLLKPKDTVLQKFPDVVENLMRDRRPITGGSRSRALGDLRTVGAEKGRLLAEGDAAGKTVDPQAIVRQLDTVLDDVVEGSPYPSKDLKTLKTLARLEQAFTKDNAPMSLTKADKVKNALQSRAERGFRQAKLGTRLSDTKMKGELALATGAKQAIEDQIPAIGKVNTRYADVKGQALALKDALKRNRNTLAVGGAKDALALAGGGGAYLASGDPETAGAVGIATRLLATPGPGSAAALTAKELARIPYAQLLRLAILNELAGTATPTAGPPSR